jgi:basic amino acid/polyamine antiporter, APA family
VAFVYGWVLLLVTQTGGMAAVAVTFARYFREITGLADRRRSHRRRRAAGADRHQLPGRARRQQRAERHDAHEVGAIAVLVVAGLIWGGNQLHPLPLLDQPVSFGLLRAIGAAMIPVAFAYGGWQTSTFVAGEMRDPRRDLSRGLIAGVIGVIVLYLSVSFVCLRVLGPAGWLHRTRRPRP